VNLRYDIFLEYFMNFQFLNLCYCQTNLKADYHIQICPFVCICFVLVMFLISLCIYGYLPVFNRALEGCDLIVFYVKNPGYIHRTIIGAPAVISKTYELSNEQDITEI
jgi:hypothetical protein